MPLGTSREAAAAIVGSFDIVVAGAPIPAPRSTETRVGPRAARRERDTGSIQVCRSTDRRTAVVSRVEAVHRYRRHSGATESAGARARFGEPSVDFLAMRTACYARFSSDLQRQTSLEDQVGNCREHAQRHGWEWQDAHVYSDAGISGASIDGRPGLQALITAATHAQRPFDILLVDDSSRVSRDLADALRIVQGLKFAGVRVVYISQGIDSDSEQHETLIAVHGLVDGLYLREMAAKIKRGIKGQLARGYATGGRTYGYRSVGVPDPNHRGRMIGCQLEIDPAEASTIRVVFQWYAEGISVPNIITRLAHEGCPAPRGGTWRVGAIQRILRNSKYLGRLIWGGRRWHAGPARAQGHAVMCRRTNGRRRTVRS